MTSRTWAISLFLNTFFPSLNPVVTRIWSPTLTCIDEETSTSHLPLADGLNCRAFPLRSSVTLPQFVSLTIQELFLLKFSLSGSDVRTVELYESVAFDVLLHFFTRGESRGVASIQKTKENPYSAQRLNDWTHSAR